MKTPADRPQMANVKSVVRENPCASTLALDLKLKAKPGQFIMLWIPGVDEKPFSLSRIKERTEITVKNAGPFSERLLKSKKGSQVWVRGPYGNGFTLKGKKICFISGGVGLAPLMPLIEEASRKRKNVTVIAGFRDKKNLLFQKRLSKAKAEIHVVTDDGSFNRKAYATDILEEQLGIKTFDQLYCCGPEPMMKKTLDLCLKKRIPCQMSVERYMKCAVGICGQCCLDGLRVCKDGPVFTGKELKNTEFGRYTRNAEGRRIAIHW
jgi:dihydroorotate dehydrogenase electron transfer subunit